MGIDEFQGIYTQQYDKQFVPPYFMAVDVFSGSLSFWGSMIDGHCVVSSACPRFWIASQTIRSEYARNDAADPVVHLIRPGIDPVVRPGPYTHYRIVLAY
jgi:hypothetical protein